MSTTGFPGRELREPPRYYSAATPWGYTHQIRVTLDVSKQGFRHGRRAGDVVGRMADTALGAGAAKRVGGFRAGGGMTRDTDHDFVAVGLPSPSRLRQKSGTRGQVAGSQRTDQRRRNGAQFRSPPLAPAASSFGAVGENKAGDCGSSKPEVGKTAETGGSLLHRRSWAVLAPSWQTPWIAGRGRRPSLAGRTASPPPHTWRPATPIQRPCSCTGPPPL